MILPLKATIESVICPSWPKTDTFGFCICHVKPANLSPPSNLLDTDLPGSSAFSHFLLGRTVSPSRLARFPGHVSDDLVDDSRQPRDKVLVSIEAVFET
jgi:hypothetical protein